MFVFYGDNKQNDQESQKDCKINIDPNSSIYEYLGTTQDVFIDTLRLLCTSPAERHQIIREIIKQLHLNFRNPYPKYRNRLTKNQKIRNILKAMDGNASLDGIINLCGNDEFEECLRLYKKHLFVTAPLIQLYAEKRDIKICFNGNGHEWENGVYKFTKISYKSVEYVEVIEQEQDKDPLSSKVIRAFAPSMLTLVMVFVAILPQLVFTLLSVRSAFMPEDDSQSYKEVWDNMSGLLRTLYCLILGTTLTANVFFTLDNTFAEMQKLIDKMIDRIVRMCCHNLAGDSQQPREHSTSIKMFCVTLLSLCSGFYNGFNVVKSIMILFGGVVFGWPITLGAFVLGSMPCMIANHREIGLRLDQLINTILYHGCCMKNNLSPDALIKHLLSTTNKNIDMIDENTLQEFLNILKNSQNIGLKRQIVDKLFVMAQCQTKKWEEKCCGNAATETVKLSVLLGAAMFLSAAGNYNFFSHVKEDISGVLSWLGINGVFNDILSIPPAFLGMSGNIALGIVLLRSFINPFIAICHGNWCDKFKKFITVAPTILVAGCASFLNVELTVTNPDIKNKEGVTMLLLILTIANSLGLTFRSGEGFVRRGIELSLSVPIWFLNCCGCDIGSVDLRLSSEKKRYLISKILNEAEKGKICFDDIKADAVVPVKTGSLNYN